LSTGIGVVPTGFYGITDMASEDAIRTVTQLVYDHGGDNVEELLLALGLIEPIRERQVDLTQGGTRCNSGLHTLEAANRYPLPSGATACRICKRISSLSYVRRKAGRA
jgi:hypothetical protein